MEIIKTEIILDLLKKQYEQDNSSECYVKSAMLNIADELNLTEEFNLIIKTRGL